MGNLNSKQYDFLPIDCNPVSSFDSIHEDKKNKLWHEGFRCPGCQFYLEPGVLKEGEMELTYVKEDRYKNGELRWVRLKRSSLEFNGHCDLHVDDLSHLFSLSYEEKTYFNGLGYKLFVCPGLKRYEYKRAICYSL